MPSAVSTIDKPACRYRSERLHRAFSSARLCLAPDASPWGQMIFRQARGEVRIPKGPAQHDGAAWISLRTPTVRLTSWVEDVGLHAAGRLVLGKVVVPGPRALLHWSHAWPGRLSLRYAVEGEPVVGKHVVEQEVPCGALQLEARNVPHFASAPRAGAVPATMLLPLGQRVPLRLRPGGRPRLELRATWEGARYVERSQQRAGFSRIAIDRGPYADVVFGWVPSAVLTVPAPGAQQPRRMTGVGGGVGMAGRRGGRTTVRCDWPVPFSVEYEGRRASVGWIEPDVALELYPEPGAWRRFVPRGIPLSVSAGAELWAPRVQLQACRPEGQP